MLAKNGATLIDLKHFKEKLFDWSFFPHNRSQERTENQDI